MEVIVMALAITTPAFTANQRIPERFSRDGANVSPQLEWHGEPAGTRSFALVMEDPDAPKGTFRHWAVYNIPAGTHRLAEGAGSHTSGGVLAVTMATNDFGNSRYDGPQPPPGHGIHHYRFRLFALDVPELDVPANCEAEDVLEAARAHALEEGDTVGLFAR